VSTDASVLAAFPAHAGIRVNCLNPGFTKTNIFKLPTGEVLPGEAWDALGSAYSFASRAIIPEEVAAFAAFLLSDEARMVNGSNHLVDAGWYLQCAKVHEDSF
jgi:NAD(P)-dependent dehydrogenase (short-subunit alcohol dehydrogenase family)